ncbi:MAG: RagB/SusD family nutrient uptake outer membrane protein [Cyclobacteriaceae bacterium]
MKSINKLILGIAFVGIAFACEDQLELEPQQSVSTDAAFETFGDFQNAVLGLYEGMQNGSWYGRNFPALMDASSDNGNIPDGAGARLTIYYTLDLNPNSTSLGTWTQLYNVIGRANQIINRIDGLEADQADKNQLEAEARFVRALGHFDLMRVYAQDYNFTANATHPGVPYVTTNEIGTPSRDDAATVFSNIMADLNEAETLMQNATVTEADRASRMAVVALRARANLYMGNYTAALADADEVINTGGYTLANYILADPTQIDSWSSAVPTSEAIFEMELNSEDNAYTGLEMLAAIYNRVDGYGDLGPSQDIIDQYTAGDVRLNWYTTVGGVNFVNKYPGQSGDAREFTTPVLRLSEMILIKAECHARAGGQDAAAQTAINLITARANAPAINTTGAALLQDILDERRRELAFEGHRYGDIKRLQIDIDRGAACTLTNGNCNIPYGDKLFAWPVPQEEVDANPNMTQDDLWAAFAGS